MSTDYINANISEKNIDDNSDIDVTWTAYNALPNPSKLNYMTMAVINVSGGDHVYLCIKQGDSYIWKLICGAAGQLSAPTIALTGSVISWAEVVDAVAYVIYENDTVRASTTETSYDISELFTTVGTHRVSVVAKAALGSEFEDSERSNVVEFVVRECYYKYVNDAIILDIPNDATKTPLPDTYKTLGVPVSYTTVGEQYEYFAYPATIPDVVDVIQSGQHVLGNYTKQANTTKSSVEHKVYRTTLPQVYDESTVTYFVYAITNN